MSYILVATDFSPISEKVIEYGAATAQENKVDMLVLHCFSFPVMVNELALPGTLIDETQKDAEKKMATLERKLREVRPDISIVTQVTYGELVSTIKSIAAEKGNPWLVMMGNTNPSKDTMWFYSTLNDVAHNLDATTLAIPETAVYKKPKKICFAADPKQPTNVNSLKKLAAISNMLGAELHVFNAQGDIAYIDVREFSEDFKSLLAPANVHYHFRHQVIVNDAIKEFCTDNNIDWLAIMPGEYSFFEGLFHRSHTKALAESMDIPIIVLHEKNEV